MRVSLQIDGDASGAEKAAAAASSAVSDLGKQTAAASKTIEEGFKGAVGSIEKVHAASQAAGAANDNNANAALGLAGKLSQVAAQAAGAESALAKGAVGAVNFAKGLGEVFRTAGAFNILGGLVGVAVTAATTFYDVINSGSKKSADQLSEQSRLVGVVRDAYKDAKNKAGEFYEQSAAVTKLQALQNISDLSKTLQAQVGQFISGATTFGNIGDFITQTKQVKEELAPFEDAIFKLSDGFRRGAPDVKAFVDEVARLAQVDPSLQKTAADLINKVSDASKTALGITKDRAIVAQINGTATTSQQGQLGISNTSQQANEIDRLIKSMERQSAAQEAEARSAGKSAGEAAKLRAEFILTEAATQSGAGAAEKYADQIQKIATRAGEAAQKLALARLASETAFQSGQLGRTGIEATVADRLRASGAFGDNVDAQMNSATASAIRFNEQMRELKSTTLEVASGAFRDFRSQLQSGKTAWEAFGAAGVNALNRIIDKLADKLLDRAISGLFGSFIGGGSGGAGIFSSLFAAAGGGTFGPGWGIVGEEGPEIIKVHSGGVTVFPHPVSKPYLPGFAEGGSLSPWGSVSRFSSLPAGGAPGSSSPIEVSVTNNGSPKDVEAQEVVDGRGNRRIELILDDQQAAAISRPGSATGRAMASRFGARAVGVKR